MDDDLDEPSGEQRRWLETSRKLHQKLDAMIELVPAMKPEEVKIFIDSLTQAIWLNHQAETLDKRIEKEKAKLFD